MANHIESIKKVEQQIAKLEKILKTGSHVGAGLVLSLNVGPEQNDEPIDLPDLQLCVDTEAILTAILGSLKASRHQRESFARKEMTDLQTFFETRK